MDGATLPSDDFANICLGNTQFHNHGVVAIDDSDQDVLRLVNKALSDINN